MRACLLTFRKTIQGSLTDVMILLAAKLGRTEAFLLVVLLQSTATSLFMRTSSQRQSRRNPTSSVSLTPACLYSFRLKCLQILDQSPLVLERQIGTVEVPTGCRCQGQIGRAH